MKMPSPDYLQQQKAHEGVVSVCLLGLQEQSFTFYVAQHDGSLLSHGSGAKKSEFTALAGRLSPAPPRPAPPRPADRCLLRIPTSLLCVGCLSLGPDALLTRTPVLLGQGSPYPIVTPSELITGATTPPPNEAVLRVGTPTRACGENPGGP